jgi:hypothetical protein
MERIQLRRDSALGWSTNNPILASGEIGIKLSPTPAQIVLFKVGDGITAWNSLPYQNEVFSGATLGANTFTGQQNAPSFASALFKGKVTNLSTGPGNQTLNLTNYDYFNLLLGGATTLSLSGIPTLTNSEYTGFVVNVKQGATPYSLTWFANITWLTTGGLAPDAPAANKSREYLFTTANGTDFVGRVGSGT